MLSQSAYEEFCMIKKFWIKLKIILKDQDERNLILNIVWAFAIKGLALLVSLFSMPLYIKYFHNQTALGFWYTILSILNWISVCDLGLGNGMRNRLTEALASNDSVQGKKYVSSTYMIISLLIIPVIIIGNWAVRTVNLNTFFNISPKILSNATLTLAISILITGIGLSFVLKLINNVIYATQKSSLNNTISLISSILPLIYMFFFSDGNLETNLISLSIVHILSINLPLILVTVILFSSKTLREYRPSLKACSFSIAKKLLSFGTQFFLAQIFFMFIMSTNETFITKLFSPEYVVEYTVYYRISTLIGSFFMLALTPIWSKITRDIAQKNYWKIRSTNRILYMVSGVAVVMQFLSVPFLQLIIDIWLKEDAITVDYSVALLFAFFGGLYVTNVVLTTVANGIGELKSQIIFYGIGSILKIPVITIIANYTWHWSSVILYNSVILLLFCIYQFTWVERKVNKLITLYGGEETDSFY